MQQLHAMQYHFELYVLTDKLTPAIWTKFYQAVQQYSGVFGKFEIAVRFSDNVIRFFVSSDKDLSALSNNIEGLLLQPVNGAELGEPTAQSKERLVQFVTGGNLLDLKEKYAIQKAKDLEFAVFKVRGLNAQKSFGRALLYFKDKGGRYTYTDKFLMMFPAGLLAISFKDNVRYLKKNMPVYLDIEKSLHMLTNHKADALFEVDAFPYLSQPYYLGLTDYEFDKHSLIIGATGTGKSKLLSLYVDRLSRTALRMNYRVIIIDPHAALADDLEYIPEIKNVNFSSEGAELFAESATDISAAAELTAALFKSLIGDQFNARLDRVLRFSLYVLLTAQNMSLDTLKRFLTDLDLRTQIVGHVTGYVPDNVIRFFGSDFNEIRTRQYSEAIAPIVSLVDELQLQPALGKGGNVSLARTVQENFLTVFSLNKVSMGEKTTKTIAGLLIQQIFLLAQARAFGKKIILIVDEVSVVQNPTLASILAEARKFNLSVILSQQYFGQIEKDLQAAIFSNIYNYYVFKTSEEDARALEGNLNINIPKEIAAAEHAKGRKETDVRVKIMTELHPRECLVRLSANGQLNPCVKARTVSVAAEHAVHKPTFAHYAQQHLPAKFSESQATSTDLEPYQPKESAEPAAFRGLSLSEVLGAQSSSRKNVNKRSSNHDANSSQRNSR